MGTVERIEDLEVWRKAREFAKIVYKVTADPNMRADRALQNQLRRAVVSVVSNIAEGFGRGGNREFLQFLSVVRGSVAEACSQLYVAFDVGYISKSQLMQARATGEEAGRLLSGLMRFLRDSRQSGAKHKTEPPQPSPQS
ncbi:MAG: four helix bundle protein [Planctomycetota bacterium]